MLYARILELKQSFAGITTNPVMNAFDMDDCRRIDLAYAADEFVQKKVKKCLNYLRDVRIDFTSNYRSAYEEYNEVITYLTVKEKFNVIPIPETNSPTPDFRIATTLDDLPVEFLMELKALSFTEGNLNYREAQDSALEANLNLERQIEEGKRIAFAEHIISPLLKNNRTPTTRELIEIYIGKIKNNIKQGQYQTGETMLMIDIKQLILNSHWHESAVKSIASGVLWNVAFASVGDMIYKQIEFEGKENLDSRMTENGILVDHPYIKGLIFVTYRNFTERKYVGFYRSDDENKGFTNFIYKFCSFFNDENNSYAYRVLQGEFQ
jgi:hypothetical protein